MSAQNVGGRPFHNEAERLARWDLSRTLGLPRGARRASPLQSDGRGADPRSNRRPRRLIRAATGLTPVTTVHLVLAPVRAVPYVRAYEPLRRDPDSC